LRFLAVRASVVGTTDLVSLVAEMATTDHAKITAVELPDMRTIDIEEEMKVAEMKVAVMIIVEMIPDGMTIVEMIIDVRTTTVEAMIIVARRAVADPPVLDIKVI
jgi:uncharacterized protein involved in high-affinity Fe2+ transport